MGDEEELLQPKRPRIPRRIRLGALLLAVLVVAALIAIRVWPRSTHPSAVQPGTTAASSAVSPSTPETTSTPSPWPTAPGACNSDVDLPIVSSTPPSESTGIALLLGGQYLRTLDFDSGQIGGLPQASLRPGEYVVDLPTAAQTYAVVTKCGIAPTRALRIGTNGTISNVTLLSSIDTVLADGAHAWAMVPPSPPTAHNTPGYLIPLDGGPRVRLPANFYPSASATGGVIVGTAGGTGLLLLADTATGHVRANLGNGLLVAVGHGVVLWSVGCDPSSDKPCTLYRRSVASGTTSSYRLPRPPGFAIGTISPDGRLVAFTLERGAQDPRYQARHPIPPADIAIFHLDSGRLEIVPGIETPPKSPPTLVFSRDSRWLVIALDAGSRIRLLAWRSGLTRPYESRSMIEQALGSPPIVVLPPRRTGG